MNESLFENITADVASLRVLPPDVIRNLIILAAIKPETCRHIARRLNNLTHLDDASSIEQAIFSAGEIDSETANAIQHLIAQVHHQRTDELFQAFIKWRSGDLKRAELVSDSELEVLHQNLHTIIRLYPAIELHSKAEALMRAVGNEFEAVDFVCDIRPVFDHERDNVEAIVLLANMRLLYQTQVGERHVCEITLTEEELTMMKTKIEKALHKFETLRPIGERLLSINAGTEETE